MAAAPLSLCALLCLLLCLCHRHGAAGRRGAARDCRFDAAAALEPLQKVESEGGWVEYYVAYEERSEPLRCAGVFPIRVVIHPRGLVLPRYLNSHALAYIVQGRGILGYSFPGCTVTQQPQSQNHHKIHQFRQGDVIAMPAGAQRWLYNDGDVPVVAVYVFDTSNSVNQLEPTLRKFLLAGSFNEGQHHYSESIFRGLDVEFLSEALGVSADLARKLHRQRDGRGEIVHVEHGLQLPRRPNSLQKQQQQLDQCPLTQDQGNGRLDDSVCSMELRHNVEDPDRADIYDPRVGMITRLSSQRFPVLNLIQMSAVRVHLHKDAMRSPFWDLNSHSVMYVTHGHARVQVVGDSGRRVFDGELRRGQLLIIPQNHVVAEKAGHQGFQYVSFKTSLDSMEGHIAGKDSVLSDLPLDVIASSYGISKEEAAELKNSRRQEVGVFAAPGRFQKKQMCRGYADIA
ncbi:hypothetical protein ACP4OV_015959 [Aristida adscensionis]